MDGREVDGEEYIAAVRAGALDPYGHSADALQEQLDEFDAEWAARIAAMTAEQVAAGIQPPPLPKPSETAAQTRLRLDEEFVGHVRAMEAQSSRIEGTRRALLAEHMQRAIDAAGDAGANLQELASMVAVELGFTTGGMVRRMTDAWTIVTELPAAHEAAADGRITTAHLRIIEQQTRALRIDAAVDAQQRVAVVDALVEVAERHSTSQLQSKAKKIVNDALTEPLQLRHDTARQRRKVELFDAGDGMGDLVVRGPVLELTAAYDRLTQAARKKPKDDPRTFDQFRTDALLELLLSGVVPEDLHGVSPIRAHVSIMIPATALLHDREEQDQAMRSLTFPAALDGRVLVDRDTARRIASDTATWERLFTDPVTGVAVTVDYRRPTAAQRRWLQARDGRCRGPGCDQPVLRSEVDHTKDYAGGGATSLDNLGHLCRSDHHRIKHGSRWQVEQLPAGVLRWTSPIGQVIENAPEPVGPIFTDTPF
ncbi:HNH endonuclease signature motif containing protein [Agrococcus sp. ARC_14]|uniref:HNH endonuclease signature motif containing protein n=1 Tax=Agrococcus sp. ARC_14 TaxID=2919927 RepID=UPI001F06A2A2|nr:HNH endonuclease signature motif containing protein [Agrococcus sp. ARC_14]MCH1883443.1 HNH endonuclease [Agrococcus sp. ARC_14]